jgi:hypothetical protein
LCYTNDGNDKLPEICKNSTAYIDPISRAQGDCSSYVCANIKQVANINADNTANTNQNLGVKCRLRFDPNQDGFSNLEDNTPDYTMYIIISVILILLINGVNYFMKKNRYNIN